jgi:pimeloyl-ACP methyl ester carboxylesterase
MEEHVITIESLNIYYTTAGNLNNPILVFLPARGASVNGFNNIKKPIKELSKYYYVIVPEHPGLIRSETPTKHLNYVGYARLLHKLLAELKIKKFVILGNSFGGGVGTEFAKLYPKEVSTLILIDSVFNKDYQQTKTVTSINNNLLLVLRSRYIPFWFKKLAIWNSLGTPISFITKEDLSRKINMISPKWSVNVDYSELQVPVILLWGKSDTKIHPIKNAREIANKNPQIKLIEYEGDVPTIYKEPKRVVELILRVTKQA